jgi:hypothetical protein
MARHMTFTVRLHHEERRLLTTIAGVLARNESETIRFLIAEAARALVVDGPAPSTTHIVIVDRRPHQSERDDDS